jgi:hypothetical protein
LVFQLTSAEELQEVIRGETAINRRDSNAGKEAQVLDAAKLKIPFSAKRLKVSATPDQFAGIERLFVGYNWVDSTTVVGFVPLQWIQELDRRGISYQVIIEKPNGENANKRVREKPRPDSIEVSQFGEKGSSWIDNYGDDGWYGGDYAIPGDCSNSYSVNLSRGVLPGWAAWYYDMCQPACVGQLTSVTFYIRSEERCWLGLCIDPPVGLLNKNTSNWDYNWALPKPLGTYTLTLSSSEISTYVGYPCGYAELTVNVPGANNTCVDYAFVNYSYTDKDGTIYATSIPSGAGVYVNGNYKGTTPVSFSMPPGSYTVVFKNTCYNDYSKSVTVNCAQTSNVDVTLTYQYATINFTSSPPGASVSEGSTPLGATPFTKSNVTAGSHTYTFKKTCYTDCPQTLNINCNTTYPCNCNLTERFATVNFSSSPTGAEVWEGSSYLNTTPFTKNNVTVGSHTYTFKKTCYNDCQKTLNVTCDQTYPADCTMSYKYASISFTSTPSGFSVYEGGNYVGTTPFTLSNVQDGYHCYTAKKTGYQDCPECRTVSCGNSYPINFLCPLCTGSISGRVTAPNGNTPVPGVTITATGSSYQGSSNTDNQGYYTISNVPATASPVTVTPSRGGDQFQPSSAQCNISCSVTSCTQYFTDVSTKLVSGKITYSTCNSAPASGIAIYVDGSPSGQSTNLQGDYSVSVNLGTHVIRPVKTGHNFVPPERNVTVVDNLPGQNFTDETSATVSGTCKSSCNSPIGGVTVSLSGPTCNISANPSDVNGFYSVLVPPGQYTFSATHPSVTFDPFGPVQIDPPTYSHDFVYKTPLKLVILTSDPKCNAIKKGESFAYTIEVRDSASCLVEGATVTIQNAVSMQGTGTPPSVDSILTGRSRFVYNVVGGLPAISKALTMTVFKAGYDNPHNQGFTKMFTVTGARFIGTTYTLSLPKQTPLMVLYDPPGDESFAYLEASTSYFGGFQIDIQKETGLEYEVHEGIETPIINIGVSGGGSLTARKTSTTELEYQITNTQRYETEHNLADSDPQIKGPGGGTYFLGKGIKIVYGESREIGIDTISCVPYDSVVLGLDFSQDQTGTVDFFWSGSRILEELENPVLDSLDRDRWQQLLNRDPGQDNLVTPDEYQWLDTTTAGDPWFQEKAWCGGGGYGEFSTTTVSKRWQLVTEIEIEASLAAEFGLKVYGVGAGGKVKARAKLGVGVTTTLGTTHQNTIGYWLQDNETDDCFLTRVYRDRVFGTPLFTTRPGTRTMCPWEPWTSKNESIELENVGGTWAKSVCPSSWTNFNFTLDFWGLLRYGSEFKIYAPTELNPCGAQVLFNGNPGPIFAHVDSTHPFEVVTRITPNCACSEDTVTIRAQSACDPQIYSDQTVRVRCDQAACTTYAVQISSPPENARLSGSINIVAGTSSPGLDGVKFFVRQRDAAGVYQICFDTIPEGATPYIYKCTWNTSGWPDNNYYLLAYCVSGGVQNPNGDSVLIFVDNTCPIVIRTIPLSGASYNDTVLVEFSEEMEVPTLSCATFLVYDQTIDADIPCNTITYSARKAEFIPNVALPDSNSFEGIVKTGARDLAGNHLCNEYRWSFRGENTSPPCQSPVCFNFTDNTGENYSIVVDSGFLDGLELEECCEIGVFADTGGGLLCVGASVYHPAQLPVPVTAWKDNPTTGVRDGYLPGDTMYFKVCCPGQGTAWAYAHYIVGNGRFETGLYAKVWLEATSGPLSEEIALESGWQWISTAIDPNPCKIESTFAHCWSHLDIIKACDGSFCIPGVGCWIDCWNVRQTYNTHMSAPCTIQVFGNRVSTDTPCPLHQGWNCVAYVPDCPLGPQFALSSIWNNLDIVKNDRGQFCIPSIGCWIDCMQHNEGYKVHLSTSDTLIYPTTCPPCPPPFAKNSGHLESIKPVHFSYRENTGESYSIVVDSASLCGLELEDCDEIGVFADTGGNVFLCVGASVYHPGSTPIPLTAWNDDPQTGVKDGYIAGGTMYFEVWSNNQNLEQDACAHYSIGDGHFEFGMFSKLWLEAACGDVGDWADNTYAPKTFTLFQNQPNPFNPETKISYYLPKVCNAKLTVYNLLGQRIKTLFDGQQEKGLHTLIWDGRSDDGSQLSSGIYFYRIQAGNFVQSRKMVLMK